jgi:uncharacterized membrane protein
VITIRKSVSIQAPLDRVYEFMTTPENLPTIWPSMVEVSNVSRKPDGSHSFDWVYKMAGIRFKGHSASTEVEKNKRVVVSNTKGIEGTFRWLYAGENGGTKLTMEVEYVIPVALFEKLAGPFIERINEHEAEHVLNNLKTRMEMGPKATAGKAAHP